MLYLNFYFNNYMYVCMPYEPFVPRGTITLCMSLERASQRSAIRLHSVTVSAVLRCMAKKLSIACCCQSVHPVFSDKAKPVLPVSISVRIAPTCSDILGT